MSAPENLTVFNGIDISRLVVVGDVERPVLAKRKLDTKQLPGAQGSHITALGYETATIKLSCRLRSSRLRDVAATLHELAHVLQTDKPCRLILPDDPERSYLAIYVGGDAFKSDLFKTKFSLTFQLADPVAYGAHYEKRITAQEQVFFTNGTYQTRPIIRCVPNNTRYIKFRNKTTGEYVGIHANFDGTSELVIDCTLERATINGRDTQVDLDSDFFALNSNDILQKDGDVDSYVLEWEERFI